MTYWVLLSRYKKNLYLRTLIRWREQETSVELPNFSIGIDLLGPDPTSNKNKGEKNSQVARFANLSEDQLQQFWPKDIHWEQKSPIGH